MINRVIHQENADLKELSKFSELAHGWWDKSGAMKLLHTINPLRLNWVKQHTELRGKRILDIGCGGGILAESLALQDSMVKGIDLSEAALCVARLHSLESGLSIEYAKISAERLAEQEAEQYDVVICMEMLEHVPDPQSIINACAKLVKPAGKLFFSTINRTLKAYLLAIIGAEYCLKLLARGTHDYAKFIRPAELAHYARHAGLIVEEVIGMSYNPCTSKFHLQKDVDVNYFMACRKSET